MYILYISEMKGQDEANFVIACFGFFLFFINVTATNK